MEIQEIQDINIWEEFVKKSPNNNFMQSWYWGEFQSKGLGRKIWRLGVYESSNLISVAQCVEETQKIGKFIYSSRGPILSELSEELYKKTLNELVNYFKNMDYIFLKIDPAITQENTISKVPNSIGFQDCINYVQPETPWMMDLVGQTEEEFMSWCKEHGMGKNYPTYIRKARKEGVSVRFSNDINDWEQFTKYLEKSSHQKEFVIRKPDYYLKQLEYMGDIGMIRLAIAQKDNQPLSMLILSYYGDEVSCLYSTQTGLHPELRSPMLLRWECMLGAKDEGFKKFNSWSVLPDEKYTPKSSQYGYSNFKRGFGGYLVRYERTKDYPFNKLKYGLVRLVDIYRKLRYYNDR